MDPMGEQPDTTQPDENEPLENPAGDHTSVRPFNHRRTLNHLRIDGPKPRVAIAKSLGLSRATVSGIIEDLVKSELVYEGEKIGANSPGPISKGGKRATQVHFNTRAGYIIGIDLGRSRLRIYLTDLEPRIIDQLDDYSFDIKMGSEKGIPFIANRVKALMKNHYTIWEKVRGIGLAFPGVPDPVLHNLISPPDLTNWRNGDISMLLRNELGRKKDFPIYLENDANMGALGESRYGAGKKVGNLIYIKLSSGIGAGLLLNGNLYRGNGAAGEFGHVFVEDNKLQCPSCGHSGCLEVTAGLQAIVKNARKVSHSERVLSFKNTPITPEHMVDIIIAAQEEGDIGSQEVLKRAGEQIGQAIGNCLINIYNPSVILLDGGIVRPSKNKIVYKNEFLLKSLYQSAKNASMPVAWQGTQILDGKLGDDAVGFGTIATVIDNDVEFKMPEDGSKSLIGAS
jgi:predicted NBD/HSP70 family sugar kinase